MECPLFMTHRAWRPAAIRTIGQWPQAFIGRAAEWDPRHPARSSLRLLADAAGGKVPDNQRVGATAHRHWIRKGPRLLEAPVEPNHTCSAAP